jgi:hypothetical protein
LRTSNLVLVLNGSVSRLSLDRTFIDGQLFHELSVVDNSGQQQTLREVFCTNRLLEPLGAPGPKEIHIWNRHIFAINMGSWQSEDIEGTRRSFLYRDRFLLLMLVASIVMLPYAAWVVIKKFIAIGSLPKVRNSDVAA